LARQGYSELATRNWVSAVLAQAVAGIVDHAACERALEQAERVRVFTRPGNGGWLRFDGSRLVEDRASCYVQQRRPDLAEPILLELLKKHPSGRRRGIALADLAAVSAQRPDVLRLVTYGAAAPRSGSPEGSHLRAPTERSVTVSRHSAPATLVFRGCFTQAQWAK
jgi:hypothetical protein